MSRLRYLHQLILETFVGPCPEGQEGLHENDIRTDNRLENLRWGTPSDNMQDRIRNGLHHNSIKQVCKNGHELVGDNVIVTKRQRVCRKCARLRQAAYNQKLREHGVKPGKPGARLPAKV